MRVVTDLLAAELAQARPGRPPRPAPWPADCDFRNDLGVDSLELLGMATALADALHLASGGGDGPPLSSPCMADWLDAARLGLGNSGGEVSFRTSGSTGGSKRCTHALATLCQEAQVLATLAPGRRRILGAVPSHHIYGFLFSVLLPHLLGVEVVDVRAGGPHAALAHARAGDLIVGHPAWWEALLRLSPRFADDVTGVSSGAPCPDTVADGLANAGLRLLQVYGSSETAGVGWREDAGSPFTLMPFWRRGDDEHALQRRLPDGTEVTRPLQDRLAWHDAHRFVPAGRIDHAVQVGGVNVFPAYVADVLRLHPRVGEVAVRLMRPDEGGRLKAFVVPRDAVVAAGLAASDTPVDDAGLREELAAWVAARLSPAECPRAWTFGPRLPRQASGKPGDWIIDAA